MTVAQFKSVTAVTALTFWQQVYKHLSPDEIRYLDSTPIARRNLDKRIIRALAETLLSPDQITRSFDLELQDPQDNIPDAESGLQTQPKELLP